MLKELQIDATEKEVKLIMKEMDLNGDGEISLGIPTERDLLLNYSCEYSICFP